MLTPTLSSADTTNHSRINANIRPTEPQAANSAVAWGAILAGAAAAAALSLILLILGTGLGLSAMSPWAQAGATAVTLGVSTIAWITLTQLLASGMGGYLAGRLRTKWVAVHTDEVFFRDTAHGFLAWAVASLTTAALLTSTIGTIVSSGVQAGASVVGGAATAAMSAGAAGAATAGSEALRSDGAAGPMNYFVDALFRKDAAAGAGSGSVSGNASAGAPANVPSGNTDASPAASASEVTRILMNSVRTGALPAEDVRYVGQVVAQRTGLSQTDAEKRVTDTYTRMQTKLRDAEVAAKQAADTARKASAYAALWLFVSLLIGAFVASLAATFGGRQRDL